MLCIKSTSDFEIESVKYPNFPLLTWETDNSDLGIESGNLCVEAMQFLIYECLKRGRVNSENTWWAYGNHLAQFLTFCEQNNLDWRDISESSENEMLVSAYRDLCVGEFGMSVNSTNQHLRTIVRFYSYGVGKWFKSLPYSLESVSVNKGQQFLAHTERNGGKKYSSDLIMKTFEKKPKFLSAIEVQELLSAIENPTLKLMVRLCIQTGIRRKELLLFPLHVIHKPTGNRAYYEVNISRTKGEKERKIHIPTRLMEDLWRYVNEARFQKQQESGVVSNCLFLTSDGQEWTSQGSAFGKALKSLNLTFHVSPHMLRHTYATHMLKGMLEHKSSKFEPLMYLQARLGHSSITTTMKYLHLVNDLVDDFSIEYQQQIDAIA
ncbi:tyrosine-type recombinase/integrase [Vibrio fortis]|uniref:Tyrosine-type recombinase/integrase n=1 Tax=Vibrio fortis TaxID=212667 RepID=A0A5N3S2V1_9VIBR|nr:tyrosine-type recombinase/integrase [Vibrio fortis]KAB0300303.1 tyrosine-type recombinase/integrase [Vibrio fortis]